MVHQAHYTLLHSLQSMSRGLLQVCGPKMTQLAVTGGRAFSVGGPLPFGMDSWMMPVLCWTCLVSIGHAKLDGLGWSLENNRTFGLF